MIIVITLGTAVGSALFVDGARLPTEPRPDAGIVGAALARRRVADSQQAHGIP